MCTTALPTRLVTYHFPPIPSLTSRHLLCDVVSSIIFLTIIQPFFGAMGCTAAIVFTCLGASYGTAKSGVGIAAMGVLRPDLIVKNIVR
jgi:hypothetical protein